jgi:ribonuclease BN (tRNA processing enzyme)
MPSDFEGKDGDAKAAVLGRLRKLVLLGDTNNPEEIIPLVNSSPGHVALAVHEATDCYIPTHVDPQQKTGKNRSTESVHAVSLQRGHSTPHMAGKFANEIGARRLVLNHLGGRCVVFCFLPAQSGIECAHLWRLQVPSTGKG